jgi:CheY-like chemotaxis protein
MPEGGVLTVRTIAEDIEGGGQRVLVEVTDTGVGMNEETRQRCLEPFYTTKGERGTGLGLAMVYGMIQRHSALFDIASVPGEGTTIRIEFIAYTRPLLEDSGPNAAPAEMRRLRVLVVDDDPIIIKALEDALTGDGHAVQSAPGGQAALNMFEKALAAPHPYDVVITDLGMPTIDGRRVAETVKRLSPRTPVVMLTGWGSRMLAEKEVPANVDRLLAKPPRLLELRATLRSLVG